jgi:dTDP-4-amino-4,6-dideoxygalactose transaminase
VSAAHDDDDEAIPFLDLAAQAQPLLPELVATFERVAASGRYVLGAEVERFEQEIASYIGVRHAIGVSSGSDALLASLMALGVGPGDEVITTPMSFFATAGAIVRLGARPVFADIDPSTFNVDPSNVEAALTPRTRVVMPVHLYGQCADLPALSALCRARNVALVEDAAQAIGAGIAGHAAGSVGVFGCFSFYPTKNLGALGDAGLVVSNDDEHAARVRRLRAQGARIKYEHEELGGNFRIDALQAALLRVKLPHLDAWNAARNAIAERYDRAFADVGLPPERLRTPKRVHEPHVYHQYILRTDRRDALRAHLQARGIGSDIHYPRPLHLQPALASLGHHEGDCPEAERAAREVLALPITPELKPTQQDRVVDEVVRFLKR